MNADDTHISEINVINLDRTPERWQTFVANNPDLPIRRFPAVDGKELDRNQLIAQNVIGAENPYSLATLGILKSHILLWKKCVASGTPFHIAEDDAIIHPDFVSRSSELLRSLKGWDICYWSWNFDWPVQVDLSPILRNVAMVFDQSDARRRVMEFKLASPSATLVRLHSCAGIGCYSISPSGAARLLDRCLPLTGEPARAVLGPATHWLNNGLDVEMSRHLPGLFAFACLPPLALLPNDQSTFAGSRDSSDESSLPVSESRMASTQIQPVPKQQTQATAGENLGQRWIGTGASTGSGQTYAELREKLWHGAAPFGRDAGAELGIDLQGWGASQHPYLSSGIALVRPRIIIEIGVWKGGSALFMAKTLQELNLDSVVIAVDTWLGGWDHWLDDVWFGALKLDRGYPQLYNQFAANVIGTGLADYVLPLPLDSVNAREVISRKHIVADMVHIDAGHDFAAISADLAQWWQVLRPGGLLVVDDYVADGSAWPDVKRAVDTFLESHAHSDFQQIHGKCAAFKAR